MKLDEFINKYINTKVDFDKAFGAQCVDLFRQYCKDVLNIPHTGSCSTTGGAIDLFLDWEKMPLEKKYFKKILINNLKEIIKSFSSSARSFNIMLVFPLLLFSSINSKYVVSFL